MRKTEWTMETLENISAFMNKIASSTVEREPMARFIMFTNKELDAMESAFCNEGLGFLVEEIRRERRYRESAGRSR